MTDNPYIIEERELDRIISAFIRPRTEQKENDENISVQISGRTLLKKYGAMLAGGAINSLFSGRAVSDLDFYLKDKDNAEGFAKALAEHGFKETFRTDNAITLTRKGKHKTYEIQIITRFQGTPQEILDTFDFTIVQGLYDFETSKFHFADNFLKHIAQRKLVYSGNSKYPICALYRTRKYGERGYKLPGTTMVQIALAIHALEIKTYQDMKEQLMGIDTAFLKVLNDKLDASKELKFEASEFVAMFYELCYGEDMGFEGRFDKDED
jgi:hypothetical protein